MKERFFKLAAKENFPNTPGITKELDELQDTIESASRGATSEASIRAQEPKPEPELHDPY